MDDAPVETVVVRVLVAADQVEVPFAAILEHIGTGRMLLFHGGSDLVDPVLQEMRIEMPDGASREKFAARS
jgi:hypothetical protein